MNNDKVAQRYNDNAALEDQRLRLARLEYEVTLCCTREAVRDIQNQAGYSSGLGIADIGCGCGAYSIPLACEGHQLLVCDISSAEVEVTIRKAREAGVRLAASSCFDARDLRRHDEIYKPNHYDIVLLPGPLYHILDEVERADVLLAALEIVKPGGFVLAAFVTRNAHLRDVATRDPDRLSREWEFYEQYLKDGKHTRGTKAPMHHSSVQEVRGLISNTQQHGRQRDVQSELVKLVACEGFLGFHHGSQLVDLDDDAFAKWLSVVVESSTDQANLGAADHILAIIQRKA